MLNTLSLYDFTRVEICGGIASGKTTFADLMRNIGFNVLFENFQSSPFLSAFYLDSSKYAFETEISFILQHYHQIKKEQVGSKINICDFSFLLDLAYAEIGLKGSKFEAFQTIHDEIKRELAQPVLLMHLICDANTELTRIRNRGRAIEESINLEFLERLNKAVERQVENARRELNVIRIDSGRKDFANDEIAKEEVIKTVSEGLRDALKRKTDRRIS